MKRFTVLILLGCTILPHRILANCGTASCPLNNYRYLQAGFFRLSFSHEYINQNQIFVGSSKSFVGALPNPHDEVQTVNERNILGFEAGITDRLALAIEVPFVHREHSHIESAGTKWEYWNFDALSDISLSAHLTMLMPSHEFDPYLSIAGGVKLATGQTDIRNAEGEPAEVTLQPGSGAVDGLVGLQFRQTIASVPALNGLFSALPVSVGLTYEFRGTGTSQYKFGNALLAHLGTSYQFARQSSFLLQANFRTQEKADVGSTGEFPQNTGGTWLFLSPGLSVQLTETFSAYGYIQIPVYQNVNGIQQTAPFNLLFGISANVGLLE